MTILYVRVSYVVAIDVTDHYEGHTDAEVAENAATDPDLTEWLGSPLNVVEFDDYEVETSPEMIDLYADTKVTWRIRYEDCAPDGPTPCTPADYMSWTVDDKETP